MLRRPGIEPGSQEWESCMIPLHQRRFDGSLLSARLAQSVEHETLNLRVVGSSPTLGDKKQSVFFYSTLLNRLNVQ